MCCPVKLSGGPCEDTLPAAFGAYVAASAHVLSPRAQSTMLFETGGALATQRIRVANWLRCEAGVSLKRRGKGGGGGSRPGWVVWRRGRGKGSAQQSN